MYHISSGQNSISFTLMSFLARELRISLLNVSLWNIRFLFKILICVFVFSSNAAFATNGQKSYNRSPAQVASKKPVEKISIYGQAQDLFRKKDYAACEKLLWKNIDSLNRDGLILLARVHLIKKEFPEVIRITQMVLSKDERDAEAHTLMGNAHFLASREKEALASYKRATEINGIYEPAYEGLIAIYEKRENLYELRILYQDLIEKIGERAEYLTKICEIDTKDALNDHAIEYCRKAIQKNEDIPENHVNLGLVYKNQGDLNKAQEKLKIAAERFTKSLYAQTNYAQFAESKSNFIDSYKFYGNCLKLSPENESCLVGHGLSALQIQKLDESLQSFKKACFKDRKNAVSVRKAVQILKKSKKTDWAQKFETLSEKCMLQ